MVWREAPALADPFLGALRKRAAPHRYTAPAGWGKTPKGGWFVTSGGRAGEGGLERSKGLFSQVPNPPLARLADGVSNASGGLEERLHRKGRRQEKFRLGSGGGPLRGPRPPFYDVAPVRD